MSKNGMKISLDCPFKAFLGEILNKKNFWSSQLSGICSFYNLNRRYTAEKSYLLEWYVDVVINFLTMSV